jgi:8-oxo-dGTP pyrophosphatase MutT (NUDIX family)
MIGGSGATVGVGVVAVDSNGSVLAGWRHKAGELPSWCLPGGHVHPGESFADAAMRELVEETAITAVRRVQPFVLLLGGTADRLEVTVGVLIDIDGPTPAAAVTEPAVFASWRWWSGLPEEPLFPASGHVLDAWRNAEPRGVVRHFLTDDTTVCPKAG